MATAAYPNKLARIRPSWRWFYILLALLASSIIAFVILLAVLFLGEQLNGRFHSFGYTILDIRFATDDFTQSFFAILVIEFGHLHWCRK